MIGYLTHWRLHLATVIAVLIAEAIGVVRIPLSGQFTMVLLPLVPAFAVGLMLNPHVIKAANILVKSEDSGAAAQALQVAVMPLIALLSVYIGPQFSAVADVGAALVLQEIGNLGTVLLSMPLAVLAFRFGREAIGATFSIAREGGIAFIFGKYGGGSAEATGVMGVYICGTVFGALVFSLLPSLAAALSFFDPRAIAMACGTGSASMPGACSSSLAAIYPENAELIGALAASSNLMTGLTGLFFILFITLPLTERYYRWLKALRP
ncbi:MAG: DUF3100 domain-containing protein [Sphingomonadales bacterium]